MTNIIRAIFVSAIIIMLSACGGGGGSAGNTSGSALFTNAAEKITIAPGEIHKYQVGGGTSGYSASSSTSAVTVLISGNILTITGVSGGSATVTVSDSSGAKVVIEATIGTGVDFYTTAPDELAVGVGVSSQAYLMGGGSRVYSVTSSNREVVTVTQNGSQFFITGISSGKATISATDTLGGNKKINVIVGSSIDLYTTAPSAVTVAVGSSSAIYSIGGGSQIYSVSSDNSNVATVGQSGNTFVITGKTGGRAVVVVKDTGGKEIKIDVVVGTSNTIFSTAASTISLAVNTTNTYKVGGGTTIYSVGSSNTSVATAVITGNDLIITGVSNGSATVIVRDNTTGSLSIDVTVGTATAIPLFTSAPSDIVVQPGTTPVYLVSGGKAPYLASSSNNSVMNATISGSSLSLSGLIVGSAKILVTDALGATVTINAVVGTGAVLPLFTTAPGAVTLAIGDTASYTINGGSTPYVVSSGNPNVATTVLVGTTGFSITGAKVGNAAILVTDSKGATVTVNASITATASTPIDILPGDATGSVGDTLTFKVSGGSPSFNITNNNSSIATVTPTSVDVGGTFTAKLLNVGSTEVTVVDAQGQFKKIKITANAASSLLRLSPSVLNIGEDSTNTISLSIYGGTAPYRAFTSDLVMSSVSVTGTTLDVALGSQGTRCVRPVDSSGTFQIGGTYTVNITVVDSLGASATSSMIIKDNSKGGAGCL
jgi:hypothetical protein